MKYTQNDEQDFILKFFENEPKGTLLDIGANDGITFSNSRALIERGWSAHLVEPSPVAMGRCKSNEPPLEKSQMIWYHQVALSDLDGESEFHESGSLITVSDTALVSSLDEQETRRWRGSGVTFSTTRVKTMSWQTFWKSIGTSSLRFISIDAEGLDVAILTQIDLEQTNTALICVEWNSNQIAKQQITTYCGRYNFRLIHQNAENLILANYEN